MDAAPLKIGIPLLNRGDLLRRLVDSVDVEAEILLVVNSIGPVDPSVEDAVGNLETRERPGVQVRVGRAGEWREWWNEEQGAWLASLAGGRMHF